MYSRINVAQEHRKKQNKKHVLEMQLAFSSKFAEPTHVSKMNQQKTTFNFKADLCQENINHYCHYTKIFMDSSCESCAFFFEILQKPSQPRPYIKDPQGTGMTSWNHSSPRCRSRATQKGCHQTKSPKWFKTHSYRLYWNLGNKKGQRNLGSPFV